MGKGEYVLIALLSIAALTLFSMNPNAESEESHMFDAWMSKFNKQYSGIQRRYRLGVWMKNLEFVTLHNAKYAKGQ